MKVELRGISKSFGKVQANDQVSMLVPAGAIVGLLGENGAGKSTLVKILSGFLSSDRGKILLDDQPVRLRNPAHAVRSGIGMLHQDPLDFPPLTVLDNFMTGQSNRFGRFWLDRQAATKQLKHLCQQYGFALAADQPVSKLSVGERQQLEISRLLSLGVNTLILDEPTTGISLLQKLSLFATIKDLAAAGKSIIFVSHKLEDVETLCDRVVVMRHGKVVGQLELNQLDLSPSGLDYAPSSDYKFDDQNLPDSQGLQKKSIANPRINNLDSNHQLDDQDVKKQDLDVEHDHPDLVAEEVISQIDPNQVDRAAVNRLALDNPQSSNLSKSTELSNQLSEVDLEATTGVTKSSGSANEPNLAIVDQLVEMMFGRELAAADKPETAQPEPNLRLEAIEIKSDRLGLQINELTAQRGEVMGLAGLEGNGQRLLLLLCAGLLTANSGNIYLGDTNMTNRAYKHYLKAGVRYLPTDRLAEGLVRGLSIQEHFALRSPKGTFINWRYVLAKTHTAIDTYNIRGFPTTRVEQLSGGNQQRTQLALLAENLNLLLMEHPTRGLDIDSAQWVWQQLVERCRRGTTILFISADLDEIVRWSDRVLVFSGGQVSEPIATKNLTAERLGQMIGGKF